MQKTRVIQLGGDLADAQRRLSEKMPELQLREVSPVIAWQMKADEGIVTAYPTGKVVLQGSPDWIDRVAAVLQPVSTDVFTPRIGVDEAGKGDFFGPLTIGAVYVGTADEEIALQKLGVHDSKQLSDGMNNELAKGIRHACAHVAVVGISPSEYNKRYAQLLNVNKLLAQGHAQAIEQTLHALGDGACPKIVIDQFSKSEHRILDALLENGRACTIVQRHHGESDIAVAAASILAREAFLTGLRALSERYGMAFPKGASDVVAFGKEFMKKFSVEELHTVAKTSFRTALQVTSTFDL